MTAKSNDADHTPVVLQPMAYSFDSLASNSMKSSNPHSGCRQVEVAKTLDTTDPNPSKNQGGIAVVTPVVAYSIENHPADSRVDIDESGKVQTLTSRMGTGGGNVPMVMEQVIDVEMEVAVRKYEVDCKALCECLRDHKAASNFSNKEIAEQLNLPLTLVEHWFRLDKSFAIPDPEVWPSLKKLLGVQTDEFDQSIMEFEFKGGTYDTRNRIHTGETSPTLTCGCGNDLHLVPEEPVYCLQGNGIDRADTAGCNGKGWKEDTSYPDGGVRYIVRRLTPTECARLQGFADRWGHFEDKTSFTPEEYRFWLDVRNTHAAINGKTVKDYTETQMLTWYNKLHTDSAEYKMWGNGIALPPALYCMQGMIDVLTREEDDAWLL